MGSLVDSSLLVKTVPWGLSQFWFSNKNHQSFHWRSLVTMVMCASLWLLTVVLSVCGVGLASASCDGPCVLPDCHCDPEAIPRDLDPESTPQIITFTFSGPITKNVRDLLTEVFPDSVKNPNGCASSITLFVLGKGSKYCEIHRLYVRGHEVALQGYNSTYPEKWTETQWRRNVADMKSFMETERYVPRDAIRGMRAPLQQPGGDEQFAMLEQSGFSWDSTLLGGPVDLERNSHWPTTLTYPLEQKTECLNPGFCPEEAYPDLWKVPLLRLSNGNLPCTYLDACVTTSKLTTSAQVFDLIFDNFERSYKKNRAPFQLNIRVQSLTDNIQKEALKQFVTRLLGYEDTWLVSVSEMLAWMQNPVNRDEAKHYLVWECDNRDYLTTCTETTTTTNKTNTTGGNLGDVIAPQTLVIIEYVLLVVVYIIVVAYDRNAYNDKRD